MSYFKTISMLFLSTLVIFGFVAGPTSMSNINNGGTILTGGEGDDPTPPPPIIDSRMNNQINPYILGGGEGDDPTPPPPIIDDN